MASTDRQDKSDTSTSNPVLTDFYTVFVVLSAFSLMLKRKGMGWWDGILAQLYHTVIINTIILLLNFMTPYIGNV